MKCDRKKFLKTSGLIIAGVAAKPVLDILGTDNVLHAQEKSANTGIDSLKRWAMVIDTGKCKEGCVDCIKACHNVHNVPEIGNAKDEIKWIWTEKFEKAFPNQEHDYIGKKMKGRPVEVLCNHCDNPPCVRVCPTQATWRRDDGIVMMDYHRCIGCRFCMAACPYGSRSFNWKDPRKYLKSTVKEFPTRTKGVVEKCNFCAERLAIGKIPACVEGCKEKGIVFGDVNDPDSEVRKVLDSNYTIRRKPGLGTKPQIYYVV